MSYYKLCLLTLTFTAIDCDISETAPFELILLGASIPLSLIDHYKLLVTREWIAIAFYDSG